MVMRQCDRLVRMEHVNKESQEGFFWGGGGNGFVIKFLKLQKLFVASTQLWIDMMLA